MSIIHVLDHQNDNILATSSKFYNDVHRETLQNIDTFDFVEPFSSNASTYLNKRNRIIIPTDDGFFKEFIIQKAIRSKGIIEVYSSASYLELIKAKPISPMTLTSYSVEMLLDFILQDSDWVSGIVTYDGIKTIVFDDYIDPYSALKHVATQFDLELNFRIETNNNKITRRYVDMVERVGEWRGKEITSGKDLLNAKRTEYTQNIVTALIGVGPRKEDGTSDLVTVSNEDARIAWGRNGQHLWSTYLVPDDGYNTDMSIERITQLTRDELQRRISTVISWEVESADIEHIFGREHEKVRLGDQVRVKLTDFKPQFFLDARIISREGSIRNSAPKKYILGEFIEYTAEDIKSLRKILQRQIDKKVSESQVLDITYPKEVIDEKIDEAVMTSTIITDDSFPDQIPEIPTNVIAEGLFKTIAISWDFNPSSYISSYEVYGSQTQGFTPDETTLIWSGKTGGCTHSAETNQTWYFVVRAVNTRGTASDFSNEVSASTLKVLTDDMVFGEEMAAELRELSLTSQLLADGSVSGDLEMTNGLLTVRAGAIGSAAIANAVISNYHLGTGIIDHAQIKQAIITNDLIAPYAAIDFAKIANVEITNADITGLLDASKIRSQLLQIGNGMTTTKLDLYTDDNAAHYIKSNQAAGFRVESTGSLSLKAGSSYGIYATGAPLVAQNGFRVDGGTSEFKTDVHITDPYTTLYANDIWKNGSAILSAAEAQSWFADINHSHYEYASSNHTHSQYAEWYNTYSIRRGSAGLKFLASGAATIQARNYWDDSYGTFEGLAYSNASRRELKNSIEEFDKSALDLIYNTPVYSYRYNSDLNTEPKRVGLIFDESPMEIMHFSGGIDVYAMAALLWKSVQELKDEINILKGV